MADDLNPNETQPAIDSVQIGFRHKLSAFLAAFTFVFGLIIVGSFIHPGKVEFIGGRIQLLFIGLFIGVSFGHFIGLALGRNFGVNIAAALGGFLALAFVFFGYLFIGGTLSDALGPGGALLFFAISIILGHYSMLIKNNDPLEEKIDLLAKQISPAILTVMWLIEIVIPPVIGIIMEVVGIEELSNAFLTGIQIAIGVFAFILGMIILSQVSDWIEGI